MKFKPLKLSGDRFEIAPDFAIELNPEAAGKKRNVYFVMPFNPSPCTSIPTLDEVIQDETPGTLFTFYCDEQDLHVITCYGIALTNRHYARLEKAYRELLLLMADARPRTPCADTPLAFAFVLCDSTGGDQCVGISHILVPVEEWEDE